MSKRDEILIVHSREARQYGPDEFKDHAFNDGLETGFDLGVAAALEAATKPYAHGLGWEAAVAAIKELME